MCEPHRCLSLRTTGAGLAHVRIRTHTVSSMATKKKSSKKTGPTPPAEPPVTQETLSARIQRLCADLKLSQAGLAKKAGIDRTLLNRALSGQRQFRSQEIEWLAPALDKTPEQLLEGVEMSASLEGVRDELGALQKRVLEAEGERDSARALLKAASSALELERVHGKREREAALKSATAEREALEGQLEEASKRERELRAALSKTEQQLSLHRSQLAEFKQEKDGLVAQVKFWQGREKLTQAALSKSEASKVPTMILSGLVGSAVTAWVSRPSLDDNDEG
jgi:transcriptional regulator with XRE-family HTH domain